MLYVAEQGSDDDLDVLFDSLDPDRSNSVTRSEWHDFVAAQSKAQFTTSLRVDLMYVLKPTHARTQECTHARKHEHARTPAYLYTCVCAYPCA